MTLTLKMAKQYLLINLRLTMLLVTKGSTFQKIYRPDKYYLHFLKYFFKTFAMTLTLNTAIHFYFYKTIPRTMMYR